MICQLCFELGRPVRCRIIGVCYAVVSYRCRQCRTGGCGCIGRYHPRQKRLPRCFLGCGRAFRIPEFKIPVAVPRFLGQIVRFETALRVVIIADLHAHDFGIVFSLPEHRKILLAIVEVAATVQNSFSSLHSPSANGNRCISSRCKENCARNALHGIAHSRVISTELGNVWLICIVIVRQDNIVRIFRAGDVQL